MCQLNGQQILLMWSAVTLPSVGHMTSPVGEGDKDINTCPHVCLCMCNVCVMCMCNVCVCCVYPHNIHVWSLHQYHIHVE